MSGLAAKKITGSKDLYDPNTGEIMHRSILLPVMTDLLCGIFILIIGKHNEDNGWNNTDGSNDNRSWNCGVEGDTDNEESFKSPAEACKNAAAVLLMSRGIPMFLAGGRVL